MASAAVAFGMTLCATGGMFIPSTSAARKEQTASAHDERASRQQTADAMRQRGTAVKNGAAPKATVPAAKKAKRNLSPGGPAAHHRSDEEAVGSGRAAAAKSRKQTPTPGPPLSTKRLV